MGTGTSRQKKKKSIKNSIQKNWQLIETKNNLNLYKHKTDGRQGEQYNFVLDNHYSAKSQQYIYEFRNKRSQPLVRVLEYQFQSKGKKLVSRNYFRVITQRIPFRLSQCPQLSFQQCLYILSRCLDGYNCLYHHIGPFCINSNMIGFTLQGQLKVWFNQNFGLNYPQHEKGTLQSTRFDQTHRYDNEYIQIEQVELVKNIINIIEDKCQQGQFPELFRNKIRQRIGFRQAKFIIEKQYNNMNRIRLNRVDLLRNKIRPRLNVINKNTMMMYDTKDSLRYSQSQSLKRQTATRYQVMSRPIENRQFEREK